MAKLIYSAIASLDEYVEDASDLCQQRERLDERSAEFRNAGNPCRLGSLGTHIVMLCYK